MELKQTTPPEGFIPGGDVPTQRPKAAYVTPMLKGMGDIRLVTLGSSPGATESSQGMVTRKPAGT